MAIDFPRELIKVFTTVSNWRLRVSSIELQAKLCRKSQIDKTPLDSFNNNRRRLIKSKNWLKFIRRTSLRLRLRQTRCLSQVLMMHRSMLTRRSKKLKKLGIQLRHCLKSSSRSLQDSLENSMNKSLNKDRRLLNNPKLRNR